MQPKRNETVILTYSERSQASKSEFFKFGLYQNLTHQFHFIFSDFILSVLWSHKTTFLKMKTLKSHLYNQEAHKSRGARIASLTARLICTPCTSSLLFMHKGEEAKLYKSQVCFYLKRLSHAHQTWHTVRVQCKHTHASSHNTQSHRHTHRCTHPSRSTLSSWCYTRQRSKGCNTSGENWEDKMVSGPFWTPVGELWIRKEGSAERCLSHTSILLYARCSYVKN